MKVLRYLGIKLGTVEEHLKDEKKAKKEQEKLMQNIITGYAVGNVKDEDAVVAEDYNDDSD